MKNAFDHVLKNHGAGTINESQLEVIQDLSDALKRFGVDTVFSDGEFSILVKHRPSSHARVLFSATPLKSGGIYVDSFSSGATRWVNSDPEEFRSLLLAHLQDPRVASTIQNVRDAVDLDARGYVDRLDFTMAPQYQKLLDETPVDGELEVEIKVAWNRHLRWLTDMTFCSEGLKACITHFEEVNHGVTHFNLYKVKLKKMQNPKVYK